MIKMPADFPKPELRRNGPRNVPKGSGEFVDINKKEAEETNNGSTHGKLFTLLVRIPHSDLLRASHNRTRVSFERREKMLEFMMAHPDLARNRVAGADDARKKFKLQTELSAYLNSCASGATKSADKWMKCWQDWRSDVKSKAAKIRRAEQQTGGGPGPAPLTSVEESLMAFIGHEAAESIAVADTLEIPEINIDENPEELVTVYLPEDTPVEENTEL